MPRSSMVMMPSTAVSRIARNRSSLSRNAEAACCCCARVRVACLDLNFSIHASNSALDIFR